MFRATQRRLLQASNNNHGPSASDLVGTRFLIQPRNTIESIVAYFEASVALLKSPKVFEDFLSRGLVRPEIGRFNGSQLILFNDLLSFQGLDGKAKYDDFLPNEKFVEGAKGALKNFFQVLGDIYDDAWLQQRNEWEKSLQSSSDASLKASSSVIKPFRNMSRTDIKKFLAIRRKNQSQVRKKFLSRRICQEDKVENDDNETFEKLAEKEDSPHALLKRMTTAWHFNVCKHHTENISSFKPSDGQRFFVDTQTESYQIDDCALYSARLERVAPVEKLLRDGELKAKDLKDETTWPVVAQIGVVFDLSRITRITLLGDVPKEISENFGQEIGETKSHQSNEAMIAVFEGFLEGSSEPLRWKLADLRHALLPMQLP